MEQQQIYFFLAAAASACIASFLAGLAFGKRKALSEFLSLQRQSENSKRWQDLLNSLKQGGQHE